MFRFLYILLTISISAVSKLMERHRLSLWKFLKKNNIYMTAVFFWVLHQFWWQLKPQDSTCSCTGFHTSELCNTPDPQIQSPYANFKMSFAVFGACTVASLCRVGCMRETNEETVQQHTPPKKFQPHPLFWSCAADCWGLKPSMAELRETFQLTLSSAF